MFNFLSCLAREILRTAPCRFDLASIESKHAGEVVEICLYFTDQDPPLPIYKWAVLVRHLGVPILF